jgi:hypothetical protein
MTDFYPQEEGCVFDYNAYIVPCYPDAAISELSSVKVGTTAAGRISVTASSALGDGIGIALRASTSAGAPSRIPVLFRGIIKMATSGLVTAHGAVSGSFAINSITTTCTALGGAEVYARLVAGGGASYIMGMWLQTAAAAGDECLLLVGKSS